MIVIIIIQIYISKKRARIKKYQLRQTKQHDLRQTNKKKQLWNKIK